METKKTNYTLTKQNVMLKQVLPLPKDSFFRLPRKDKIKAEPGRIWLVDIYQNEEEYMVKLNKGSGNYADINLFWIFEDCLDDHKPEKEWFNSQSPKYFNPKIKLKSSDLNNVAKKDKIIIIDGFWCVIELSENRKHFTYYRMINDHHMLKVGKVEPCCNSYWIKPNEYVILKKES